jgi:MFS superfamily sulfate permease-like transporter
MFFTVYMVILTVAIVVGCIIAIIMSTSHGMEWIESLWRRRQGGSEAGRERDASAE